MQRARTTGLRSGCLQAVRSPTQPPVGIQTRCRDRACMQLDTCRLVCVRRNESHHNPGWRPGTSLIRGSQPTIHDLTRCFRATCVSAVGPAAHVHCRPQRRRESVWAACWLHSWPYVFHCFVFCSRGVLCCGRRAAQFTAASGTTLLLPSLPAAVCCSSLSQLVSARCGKLIYARVLS